MIVSEFLESLGGELPMGMALPDDPVGTQVLAADGVLHRIVVAYEVDEHVVEMATRHSAELIVAFHPLIYPSLTRLSRATRVERCVIDLVRAGIALHVVHTVFDSHPRGTSVLLAEHLGLDNIVPLAPDERRTGWGMGAIGDLREPADVESFAREVARACQAHAVRFSAPVSSVDRIPLRRIAVLGGSGMSYYSTAVRKGADAFVTADARYHAFHAANDAIPLIDAGHAETERFVVGGLLELVTRVARSLAVGVEVRALDRDTNPVRVIV